MANHYLFAGPVHGMQTVAAGIVATGLPMPPEVMEVAFSFGTLARRAFKLYQGSREAELARQLGLLSFKKDFRFLVAYSHDYPLIFKWIDIFLNKQNY
jgi:hypothetical protein